VSGDLALPTVEVQLECSSEAAFLLEVAPKLGGRFWVATAQPAAAGEALALYIALSGTVQTVRGVVRVDAAEPGRLLVRIHSLNPEGIQLAFGDDTQEASDVLMPGVWRETPPKSTEPATPPHGTDVQQLLADATRDEPEQKTAVYSHAQRKLVESIAPASALPWSGGLKPLDVLGNYQLLERLGRGRTTEVYVARALLDGGVEKLVALKVTLPEYHPGTADGRKLVSEAQLAASLQHRGVVQVFDSGEAAGRFYLAMEYVEGRSLDVLIRCMRESGGPSKPFALKVMLDVARVLEAIHGAGRAHGGLEPSNVLVSEQGEVKLIDAATGTPGGDLDAAVNLLRELLTPLPCPVNAVKSAAELVSALTLERADGGNADPAMMVRALCGLSLASEKRHVAKLTLDARVARPAKERKAPRRSTQVAVVAAVVLALGAGGFAVKRMLDGQSVERQLAAVDDRMRAGALSGPGETALAALSAARTAGPSDPRVRERAAQLAQAFELLGDAAAARGDDAEAAAHFAALSVADPGRPGALEKLLAARQRSAASTAAREVDTTSSP